MGWMRAQRCELVPLCCQGAVVQMDPHIHCNLEVLERVMRTRGPIWTPYMGYPGLCVLWTGGTWKDVHEALPRRRMLDRERPRGCGVTWAPG